MVAIVAGPYDVRRPCSILSSVVVDSPVAVANAPRVA